MTAGKYRLQSLYHFRESGTILPLTRLSFLLIRTRAENALILGNRKFVLDVIFEDGNIDVLFDW